MESPSMTVNLDVEFRLLFWAALPEVVAYFFYRNEYSIEMMSHYNVGLGLQG